MNDPRNPMDELELELQEALGQRHRAALLFADAVRLDMLDDDDDLEADPARDALIQAD
ncbi:MAG TPA: hypothetical protein VJN18_33875 [Polyangiaceae bacterium]|nr:hypothetical protein [Polyangiaceae bacterium]